MIIPDIDNVSIDNTLAGLEGLGDGWLFNSPMLGPPAVNHIKVSVAKDTIWDAGDTSLSNIPVRSIHLIIHNHLSSVHQM